MDTDLAVLVLVCRQVADWSTCYEGDVYDWTPSDPLYGHCGAVSHVVKTFLGGEIVSGRDPRTGRRHLWNELPDGRSVDLTHISTIPPLTRSRFFRPKTISPRFALMESRVRSVLDQAGVVLTKNTPV